MNVEQVVEMIDAITEGRDYELDVPVLVEEDSLTLKFNEDEISILGSLGFATAIRDTRTAREICAALLTWADRKDGKPHYNVFNTTEKLDYQNVTDPTKEGE
ncbi:hypothetical protein [Streptomyces griseosporeus]|uniref:hypothetical protein n=1 Tax=Streptomyces griseosporeus TaxID=1910 RepID=UPI00167CA44E|nr:hypothetical protein [Streptomyces griseosporeus]GHF92391.1 hypothetical protein GCM10018783_74120 [Streptomyces griseosporeus]